jgi:hypothetical protein
MFHSHSSPIDKYFGRTRTVTNSDDLKIGVYEKTHSKRKFFFLSFSLNRKKKRWKEVGFYQKYISILLDNSRRTIDS